MSSNQPKVTVLMPVYNGATYLREAIESILQQTFTDFEFLIINDGSTDKSVEIIQSYQDQRIRLVHNASNLKLIATLNKGLDLACGEYIARMDCDDISLPERLARQIALMDSRPEVAICGSWVEAFGQAGGEWHYPSEPDAIKAHLFFHSPLAHPSVIIRRSALQKSNLKYDPGYPYAEDFRLWQQCSYQFALVNIPEVLVRYRVTSTSLSRANKQNQVATLEKIYRENLRYLGIIPNQHHLDMHRAIAFLELPDDKRKFLHEAESYLKLLRRANLSKGALPQQEFTQLLETYWRQICNCSKTAGLYTWLKFSTSPLSKMVRRVSWRESISFLQECLKSR